MTGLTIDCQWATDASGLPAEADLATWARCAFLGTGEAEVTLRLVDEAESAELNGRYRNKDRPTNVLSFPFEAPPGIPLNLLGDLVICAGVVAAEARAQQKSPTAHWAHMVIHGMLHLQGYDHVDPDEADIMEGLEIRLLATLGFPDPYHYPHKDEPDSFTDEETDTHS